LAGPEHGQNADCLDKDGVVIDQRRSRGLGWRQVRRYCGDWSGQLKAIHVVTEASGIRVRAFLSPTTATMHTNDKTTERRGFVAKVRLLVGILRGICLT
jgi:hypothetical protein